MNTNTNKLKTTLTALSLITASVFTVSAAHAATQNEVQFTAVDPEGFDDNLYGARYVRYLEEVSGNSGAYLINPYLQRVSSLSGGYANLDGADFFNLGATFYIDENLMLAIEGVHRKWNNGYGESDSTDINAKLGYNLSREWQVGAGLTYQHFSTEYAFEDDVFEASGNEVMVTCLATLTGCYSLHCGAQ